MTDDVNEIIRRIATGERAALQSLHEVAGPRLFGILSRYFRNRADAEDAYQEVLIKVWRSARQFDPARKAMPWLITIAKNHALDSLRARRESQFEGDFTEIEDVLGPKPEDALSRHDLGKCLKRLNAQKARLILDIYVAGYTYEEAAARLTIPTGTVRTWVQRSMRLLRDCMNAR